MEKILQQLGYLVSNSKESSEYEKMNILFIINPDGTVRWFWPSHLTKPLFLKFYNTGNYKSQLYSLVIKLIFLFKLQSLVFRSKQIFYKKNTSQNSKFYIGSEWTIFTGTIGPNNKAVLINNSSYGLTFTKIGLTQTSVDLIQKEASILDKLYMLCTETFTVPEVLEVNNNLVQISDVSTNGKRISSITNAHLDVLIELNEMSAIKTTLSDIDAWKNIKQSIKTLSKTQDLRMPKGLIKKLNTIIDGVDENEFIEVGLSHGDFTPWNMFESNGTLHIYDWELADYFKPLGFDLFHFIIQQGILVDRKSWLEIRTEIDSKIDDNLFLQLSKFKEHDIDKYLKLYLVFNTAYYLELYSKQLLWHKQIYWQINVWNEAISLILGVSSKERELVVLDMFDFLLPKNYGTVKFPNISPDSLSENSDVDLLLTKQLKKELEVFFTNHPLVSHFNLINKSFMSTLQLFTNDGGILSVDMIYKLKRKSLELLSAKEMLQNTYVNQFGVKMLDVFDNARYIGLFYSLNGVTIPSKYLYFEEILSKSTKELDLQIYPCFLYENCDNKNLFNYIKAQKSNKGLRGILNKINYTIDTLKTILLNKGMVLTFSGVDGAGKSTVIDNLKFKIEKQLRKRVVVLRHRPSLLPILSSFTKGKKQAELDAANSLPRQGKNNSIVSSVFRFGYYYTDYIVGQFIVYTKYVLRGYVVIYDRYYYDFISDSKRSNIKLPRFIIKFGLKFLLKPKFNFFLYEDVDVILKRKQELDKETIFSLTADYQKQFNELDYKSSKSRFISIKNENIDKTINTVMDNIVFHAA